MQVMAVAYQYRAQYIAGGLWGRVFGVSLTKHQSDQNPFGRTSWYNMSIWVTSCQLPDTQKPISCAWVLSIKTHCMKQGTGYSEVAVSTGRKAESLSTEKTWRQRCIETEQCGGEDLPSSLACPQTQALQLTQLFRSCTSFLWSELGKAGPFPSVDPAQRISFKLLMDASI